jgi:hypothetical protein
VGTNIDILINAKAPYDRILFFCSRIPKHIDIWDTAFIRDKNGIIGRGEITSFDKIHNPSRMGYYPFVDYYVEYVLKDPELLKLVKRAKEVKFKSTDCSVPLDYVFSEKYFPYIEKYKKYPDIEDFHNTFKSAQSEKEFLSLCNEKEKANNLMKDCDEWLKNMGYYDDYGESKSDISYIEIANIVKTSLDFSSFELSNNRKVSHNHQWCYIKEKK